MFIDVMSVAPIKELITHLARGGPVLTLACCCRFLYQLVKPVINTYMFKYVNIFFFHRKG
jgi:hypothetical protein